MIGQCPATGDDDAGRRAVTRLTRRSDFVRAAKGDRFHTPAFGLQMTPRPAADSVPAARVGFTVTKKTGGSVARNRMRRRLREAVRLAEGLSPRPFHDYVIVARRDALRIDFATLCADLERAFEAIHRPRGARGRRAAHSS
jgi:ribonuclease P protein component